MGACASGRLDFVAQLLATLELRSALQGRLAYHHGDCLLREECLVAGDVTLGKKVIRAVRNFTKYLGRSPDTATIDDLRNYQLHRVDAGTSPTSLNAAIIELKFFFDVNSCRNRHCPKCQAKAAQRWLEARQADLLPVEYYHVVFTLPAPIADLAYANKVLIYRLLFEVAAETLATIAADPKHLGAQIGVTLVLHTWGSAMTHHPHVHGIVPGGGLSPDRARWVACRRGFFLSVRVLSRLFRRRFLEELAKMFWQRRAAK